MSTTENETTVQQWLAQAEEASRAQDWDRTVALYRKALAFDRALQGVEAKLQWALRMRDTESLYREGKQKLANGEYEAALGPLRKARLMYASHYKDIDELILRAQTGLQKEKWGLRPMSRSAARKEQRRRNQRRALIALGVLILAVIALVFYLNGAFGMLNSLQLPFGSQQQSAATINTGAASTIDPKQRNEMYKSAPAMTIDLNKTYRATIQTSKGNIVVDLYPKDAPQHVNNFVFLARQGFYDNLTFHRVEPGFVIQGGDPLGNGTGGPGYTVPPEIGLKHSKGALAMARRSGPPQTTPSSGSQFYIALEPLPTLDGNYSVFGQTSDASMGVVQQIAVGDVIKTITIEEK